MYIYICINIRILLKYTRATKKLKVFSLDERDSIYIYIYIYTFQSECECTVE